MHAIDVWRPAKLLLEQHSVFMDDKARANALPFTSGDDIAELTVDSYQVAIGRQRPFHFKVRSKPSFRICAGSVRRTIPLFHRRPRRHW